MIPTSKQSITAFGGKIIGYVESDNKGNKQVRDFFGKILGYYDKSTDTTRDFYGRIVSYGDTVMGLLYKDN